MNVGDLTKVIEEEVLGSLKITFVGDWESTICGLMKRLSRGPASGPDKGREVGTPLA